MIPAWKTKIWHVGLAASTASGVSSGAIVYQSFEKTLSDPDTNASNTSSSFAAITFNGTTIALGQSSSGGAASIGAIEQLSASKDPMAAYLEASSGYVQSAELLTFGEEIGFAFTQTETIMDFPEGSASDVYLGVSTPSDQYGWIRFSYTESGKTVTLHDAAFQEEAMVPILAGETGVAGAQTIMSVPEPAAATLLGLAGGLSALRRRRQMG
ncbi:hypothetical protein HNR46_002223 [Haloferula luteola]|uniref:PEP-CTERM protein-sorting domain-containing protein n=1 Tax=Haloferula luteola TaxID=595692 RepID=A0A840V1W4_9BACT|nr:VPLPA-CTERM sorting domain-containing protein [Haloferula luteola]MBB5351982.1 hypothetical protein [Haloferula luteola]